MQLAVELPVHDWIGIAPPLVTTEQEADEIIAIIEKSIPECGRL